MDYVVTTGLQPPVDAPELDGLRQEGVSAVLDRQLALVEGVAGPEDSDIDVLDYRITVRPDGASVVLALEAPSLLSAEEAAATVLDEMLRETDLLTGWSVSGSEVRITEDEFNQRLAAAVDEMSGGPESELEAAVEEALGGAEEQEPALDTEHWRERMIELADQLLAFEPSVFGPADSGRLAAGALVHAVRVVTDEIFYDEMALALNNATVADAVGLLVLEELPPCYENRYDSVFARGFLLASASVARCLTQREWTPPTCVAEALALRLFINEAQVLLEAAELMPWTGSEPLFESFRRHAFTDLAHDDLYEVDVVFDDADIASSAQEAELSARGLAFDQWFYPGGEPGAGIHPYLRST